MKGAFDLPCTHCALTLCIKADEDEGAVDRHYPKYKKLIDSRKLEMVDVVHRFKESLALRQLNPLAT